MTTDSQTYARRWKTLAVLAVSLAITGIDNTIPIIALPSQQEASGAWP